MSKWFLVWISVKVVIECIVKSNCLETTYPKIAKQWYYFKNDTKDTPNTVGYGSGKKVWWICGKNHIWQARIYSRTTEHKGCPTCNESKGELKVREILNKLKIFHKSQFTIDKCKFKISLRFDFAAWIDNEIYLIEFQGQQHYGPIAFSGNKNIEEFKNTKKRDKVKLQYCRDNKIPLLTIPYWEYDNIEEKLCKFLRII